MWGVSSRSVVAWPCLLVVQPALDIDRLDQTGSSSLRLARSFWAEEHAARPWPCNQTFFLTVGWSDENCFYVDLWWVVLLVGLFDSLTCSYDTMDHGVSMCFSLFCHAPQDLWFLVLLCWLRAIAEATFFVLMVDSFSSRHYVTIYCNRLAFLLMWLWGCPWGLQATTSLLPVNDRG